MCSLSYWHCTLDRVIRTRLPASSACHHTDLEIYELSSNTTLQIYRSMTVFSVTLTVQNALPTNGMRA